MSGAIPTLPLMFLLGADRDGLIFLPNIINLTPLHFFISRENRIFSRRTVRHWRQILLRCKCHLAVYSIVTVSVA